ncbi:MAG: GNAT family N-acetyltransferase [Treponema sp.]|nr:GNAT family N-acetyltransferase [Treponema sp.]
MECIRKATKNDSKALVELSEQLGYETNEELLLVRFELLKEREQEVYVADIDNTVVGYISFEKYYTLYMEPGLNITALVVDKDNYKKGIGKKLVQTAEKYAQEHGLYYVRANSSCERIEAHKFYRKTGFNNEKNYIKFIKKIK